MILGVAVAGFAYLSTQAPVPEKRQAGKRSYNVQVFDAESQNLQEIIGAFGTARADKEVIVPAQVSGEVVELHENLRVGLIISDFKTQVLAKIDERPYVERRDRAQKQIDENQTQISQLDRESKNNTRLLDQARKDLKTIDEQYQRVRRNRERGAGSASEVTRALLEVRQYEQTILQLENSAALIPVRLESLNRRAESLKTDLKLAELDVENTVVRAPFTGAVSEVMVEKGQYVRTGDALIRLTNTQLVEIALPLALSDFLKVERQLRSGETPEVELALSETAPPLWSGRVVRVAPEADEGTRTAMVFVEVKNTNLDASTKPSESDPIPLRPGTFLHARISGPRMSKAIVVPRDAVVKGKAVFVAKDGKVERREVQLGSTLQSLVVVEQGLESGDQVLLTNLDVVSDGVSMSISDHVKLSDEIGRQRTVAVRVLPAEE